MRKMTIWILISLIISGVTCERAKSPGLARAGQPFEAILSDSLTLAMAWIPSGTFDLGSTHPQREWATGETGCCSPGDVLNEGDSLRPARITKGFWMGNYEVTYDHFSRFAEETGYITDGEKAGQIYTYSRTADRWAFVRGASWRDPGFGFPPSDDHAVAAVSWNDALSFCRWLTTKDSIAGNLPPGYLYRLPTEAEWEYACRGSQVKTGFWWGEDLGEAEGRMNGSGPDRRNPDNPDSELSTGFPFTDGYAFVAPVGSFGDRGKNCFGLSDLAGNVYEWTMDGYDPEGASETGYLVTSTLKVIKGGAFTSPPCFYRIAYRSPWLPATACAQIGFRIVLAPELPV